MKKLLPSSQGWFFVAEGIALAGLAAVTGNVWLAGLAAACFALAAHSTSRYRPLVAALGILAASGAMAWMRFSSASVPIPGPLPAILSVVAGLTLTFFVTLEILRAEETEPADRIGRFAIMLHFITAAVLFLSGQLSVNPTSLIGWTAAIMAAILSADLLLHSSLSWLQPGIANRRSALFDPSPNKAIAGEEDLTPGLADMWLWPIIRPRLLPLFGFTGVLIWLCTSIHTIAPGFQSIRSHLGRFEAQPLEPGLHFSLPWPLGKLTTIHVEEPREVVLGFVADPGKPILWEKAHYVGEELSLVGSGDDFLSISVPIFYHIGNAADFIRSTAEPDRLLRNFAYRALLNLTVNRSAEDIMLDSREAIRLELHRRLQADLDQIRSGLIIDRVSLRDIHPPVAVAPVFQEIVSAIEEKEAIIHESEQYRLEHLPTARGAASDLITKAKAAAASRKIAANSHAHRLGLQAAARAKSPSLYETREGYRAFDQSLAGAKKIITDDSLSQGTPLHLDLRRVLNSNLIDTAPPAAEPLISDPSKRRDQFNLHVEGYR